MQVKTEEQKTKQAKLSSKIELNPYEYDGDIEKLILIAKSRCEYQMVVNRGRNISDTIKRCITEFSACCDNTGEELPVITDIIQVYEELNSNEIFCEFYDENEKRLPLKVLYSVSSRSEDLLKKKVWLRSGGYIIIEQTETLNLIDVNSGKNIHKSDEFNLELNKEAALEAYRQIRLRNLSGMILIDFISFKDKLQEDALIAYVQDIIRRDSLNMRFIDMTGLGIMEFTRDKNSKSLREMLDFSH